MKIIKAYFSIWKVQATQSTLCQWETKESSQSWLILPIEMRATASKSYMSMPINITLTEMTLRKVRWPESSIGSIRKPMTSSQLFILLPNGATTPCWQPLSKKEELTWELKISSELLWCISLPSRINLYLSTIFIKREWISMWGTPSSVRLFTGHAIPDLRWPWHIFYPWNQILRQKMYRVSRLCISLLRVWPSLDPLET